MFFGWKIVVVAFVIAFFAFGIGFYSLGIYLVALNARHGWPIAFISLAITVYYVLGASLTAYVLTYAALLLAYIVTLTHMSRKG